MTEQLAVRRSLKGHSGFSKMHRGFEIRSESNVDGNDSHGKMNPICHCDRYAAMIVKDDLESRFGIEFL